MRKCKWYWFTFEDGYRCCVRGLSKAEMFQAVANHGKLISKVLEGVY